MAELTQTGSQVPGYITLHDLAPSPRSKFFQFHAYFREIWQNLMLAPPGGEILAPQLHWHHIYVNGIEKK